MIVVWNHIIMAIGVVKLLEGVGQTDIHILQCSGKDRQQRKVPNGEIKDTCMVGSHFLRDYVYCTVFSEMEHTQCFSVGYAQRFTVKPEFLIAIIRTDDSEAVEVMGYLSRS